MLDDRFCYYHEKRKLVQIDLEDVLYLEASGNYTRFTGKTETFIVRSSLEKALEALPEVDFIRVSKSYALGVRNTKAFNKTSAWFNKRSGDPDLEYKPSKSHYELALLKVNIVDRDFGEWIEISEEE